MGEKNEIFTGDKYLSGDVGIEYWMGELKRDSAEAHYQVAKWYYEKIKNSDYNKKIYTLSKKAADAGHVKAQNLLGICYENGIGIEKDIAQAFRWYKMAADQGVAAAQYNLAMCFWSSDIRLELYLYWIEKAAEQNDLEALYEKAECYEYGIGYDIDFVKANEYYEKAAELGSEAAKRKTGKLMRKWRKIQSIFRLPLY